MTGRTVPVVVLSLSMLCVVQPVVGGGTRPGMEAVLDLQDRMAKAEQQIVNLRVELAIAKSQINKLTQHNHENQITHGAQDAPLSKDEKKADDEVLVGLSQRLLTGRDLLYVQQLYAMEQRVRQSREAQIQIANQHVVAARVELESIKRELGTPIWRVDGHRREYLQRQKRYAQERLASALATLRNAEAIPVVLNLDYDSREMAIGRFGRFENQRLRVIRIIGPADMLASYNRKQVWVKGILTEGLSDNQRLDFGKRLFMVTGTTTYDTTSFRGVTVYVVEPIEP